MRDFQAETIVVQEVVIFLPDPLLDIAQRRVAGLPLMERTLRILQRSNIEQVTIVAGDSVVERSRWSGDLDLQIKSDTHWTGSGEPVAAFTADLAFEPDFLLKILDRSSARIDFWLLPGEEQAGIAVGRLQGTFSTLEELIRGQDPGAVQEAALSPEWTCQRIRTQADAREFHKHLERHLMKNADGMFARWNRQVSLPLTRVLVRLPVTPNMVTYFTLFVSAYGAYWLARGGYQEMLLGALITQVASILDGNDGELARLKIVDGDFGTWLDTICDYISYFLTFGGITWGLYNRTSASAYLWLGGLMCAGFLLSMAAVSYFRRYRVPRGQAGKLSKHAIEKLASNTDDWITLWSKRVRHFATRAVFPYCLILLGLLDLWSLALVVALIGSHLVWISCLYHAKYIRIPNE